MSEQQAQAPTRSSVLLLYAEQYRRRAGVSHERWAEDLDEHYCRLVPADHRSLCAPDLKSAPDADTYTKLRRSWDQQLRRFATGDVRIPVDLEEAWVESLGEPHRTECLRELAQRMGLWGALRSDEGPVGDHECWSRALRGWADVTQTMGQVLADGEIGPQDAELLRDLVRQADLERANLTSLIERAQQVLQEAEGQQPGLRVVKEAR